MSDFAAQSAIPQANEIPFPQACEWAGMEDVPPAKDSGARAFCPFGEYSHPDGGSEKAMRVWRDHGFCFAEWLYLTPVKIFALMNDLDDETAARELLIRAQVTVIRWEDQWDAAVGWRPDPDLGELADALRTWLDARWSGWNNLQYDPLVSDVLARCLGLLSCVKTEADCAYWLSSAKMVMETYLRSAA